MATELNGESEERFLHLEAKQKILKLFESKHELDYYDIMYLLDALQTVVEVCSELEEEGRIEVVDENSDS